MGSGEWGVNNSQYAFMGTLRVHAVERSAYAIRNPQFAIIFKLGHQSSVNSHQSTVNSHQSLLTDAR
jgi:hypothetical protein